MQCLGRTQSGLRLGYEAAEIQMKVALCLPARWGGYGSLAIPSNKKSDRDFAVSLGGLDWLHADSWALGLERNHEVLAGL